MADETTTKANAAQPNTVGRRTFIKAAAAAAATAAVGVPWIWVPGRATAQTAGFGTIKHLLYIRLSGGFRFTAAFNADVAAEFNPFGLASRKAEGAEWGVSALLERDGWRSEELQALGVQTVPDIAGDIAVLPCVDHEPLAAYADGNHGSGLERYLTGYVGGDTGLFTMINYGLRDRAAQALADGVTLLPAFVLGNSGMALGAGKYAAHRAPVLSGDGFDQFGFDASANLPDWAQEMADARDERVHGKVHTRYKDAIEAYQLTRESTKAYAEIFNSDTLKIASNGDAVIDGISNDELAAVLGNSRAARNIRLAMRLFHFGSPAVYLDQGGYDMHSGEEASLPGRFDDLNRLIAGLHYVLRKMTHPSGGSYWDHTVVAFGSEFGRTARGDEFNSARGSDHGGDLATRWMSMPFMGGPIKAG
ncbi:MAG: DUF1501 domain-containing protein, partial [Myxococcota bacterium]